MSETQICSRCHSECTLEYFGKNRKGKLFKTCCHCRGKLLLKAEPLRSALNNTTDPVQRKILMSDLVDHLLNLPKHGEIRLIKNYKLRLPTGEEFLEYILRTGCSIPTNSSDEPPPLVVSWCDRETLWYYAHLDMKLEDCTLVSDPVKYKPFLGQKIPGWH